MKQFILVLVTLFFAVRGAYAESSKVTWADEVRVIAPKVMETFGDLIQEYARETGVSPDILFGIMLVESSGNPDVPGGLMQTVSAAREETDIKCDTRKPACSMRIGSAYVQILQKQYGCKTWKQLALAYHLGPVGALKVRAPDRHPYVQRVLFAKSFYWQTLATNEFTSIE